jgi:hypothetical protein
VDEEPEPRDSPSRERSGGWAPYASLCTISGVWDKMTKQRIV